MITFLKDYWYLPLLLVGAFIAVYVIRRRGPSLTPIAQTIAELEAIRAKREVRNMQIELGANAAKQHVEDRYREQLDALDHEAAMKVEELENDPAELAKFLERLTRG